jgi:uncharacterized protein YceH (UPF0502 family)
MIFSSVTTFDDGPRPRQKPARALDATEIRILGSLIEKQLSTPEYYPLTLNALLAACNQKSNREPVLELTESEIQRALERLQDEKLAWKVMGGRAVRYDHNLDVALRLDRPAKALLALLFLRGAQTVGELRGRSDRLFMFESLDDVEALLQRLARDNDPLIMELPRRPGQKETRWAHLLGGAPVEPAQITSDAAVSSPGLTGEPLSARVQRLEEQLAALADELRALKEKLGE